MAMHSALLGMPSPNLSITRLWEPNYKKKTKPANLKLLKTPFQHIQPYAKATQALETPFEPPQITAARVTQAPGRACWQWEQRQRVGCDLHRHRWTPGHAAVKPLNSPAARSATSIPTSSKSRQKKKEEKKKKSKISAIMLSVDPKI